MKFPTLGKREQNFVLGLIIINIKVNIERLERVIGKFLRNYFTVTIASMATDWDFAIFVQCETHAQLKGKHFGNILPIGLNEKEEYLY